MAVTRRDVLARIAAAAMVGPLTLEAAQHVHEAAEEAATTNGGIYKPKALTAHEFETLTTLCEIIVPGASKGHTAEFIDLLSSQNPEMAAIYTGGLAWVDDQMNLRYQADFLAATPEQRTAMLDLIAYRKNRTPEIAEGVKFFAWTRRMAVDGYYTSAAGIKEVGYMGNRGMREFKVPEEAIDYAVKHSPFA